MLEILFYWDESISTFWRYEHKILLSDENNREWLYSLAWNKPIFLLNCSYWFSCVRGREICGPRLDSEIDMISHSSRIGLIYLHLVQTIFVYWRLEAVQEKATDVFSHCHWNNMYSSSVAGNVSRFYGLWNNQLCLLGLCVGLIWVN